MIRRRNGLRPMADISDLSVWASFVIGWWPAKRRTPLTPWESWPEYLAAYLSIRDLLLEEDPTCQPFAERVLQRFGEEGPPEGVRPHAIK
jgi:hypothetical protein